MREKCAWNVGNVTDTWDALLQDYDEIVHIPMSSGLSGSCETAIMLSQDYDGRVQVVNNQRISVTQRQSVLDAKELAEKGYSAEAIKEILEREKMAGRDPGLADRQRAERRRAQNFKGRGPAFRRHQVHRGGPRRQPRV